MPIPRPGRVQAARRRLFGAGSPGRRPSHRRLSPPYPGPCICLDLFAFPPPPIHVLLVPLPCPRAPPRSSPAQTPRHPPTCTYRTYRPRASDGLANSAPQIPCALRIRSHPTLLLLYFFFLLASAVKLYNVYIIAAQCTVATLSPTPWHPPRPPMYPRHIPGIHPAFSTQLSLPGVLYQLSKSYVRTLRQSRPRGLDALEPGRRRHGPAAAANRTPENGRLRAQASGLDQTRVRCHLGSCFETFLERGISYTKRHLHNSS